MSDHTVQKHFVEFYSPGTFMAESSSQEIDSWDVKEAKARAAVIKERHGARPFGFRFTTRSRGPNDLDSKVTDRSPMYYIGCKVLTLEEIKARNDERDETLIRNMENNSIDRVVTTTSGWKWTTQLYEGDIVLEDQEWTDEVNRW